MRDDTVSVEHKERAPAHTKSTKGGNKMNHRNFFTRIVITVTAGMLTIAPVPAHISSIASNAGIETSVAAEAAEAYFKKPTKSYSSIVDALKSIGADSSFAYRKEIAKTNGISNYTGTAAQNTQMLRLLNQGKLKKPGSGSAESCQSAGNAVYSKAKSFVGKKYPYFSGLDFHWRAWCADFVSYAAKLAGQTKAIPKNASVAGLRTAINGAGGNEYSKAKVQNGSYVPKRGDIIIFKSNGASHVGIVDCAKSGYIYYVDGNNTSNGNGNNSCVNYSKCAYGNSQFTCVLHPNYK